MAARPEAELGPDLQGQTVRLLITLGQTGETALLVPESAVQTRADGTTVVEAESDEGRRPVEVALGAAGDGEVAVSPLNGASLEEGELVVIGRSS